MPVCEICGRSHKRERCEFCRREKEWFEKFRESALTDHFTKRIAKYLKPLKPITIDIEKNRYIFGQVGSGKTIMAASIMAESLRVHFITREGNKSHAFISVPKLLQEIKSTYDKKEEKETETQIIQKMTSVDFLVLDDLGAERVSDWVLQILYLIVNERYEDLKTTIFTSNLSLDELANRLGNDRIPSRIQAMCSIQKLESADLRLERNSNAC